MNLKEKSRLVQLLLDWHKSQSRPMPWKETDDPYHIWLSEIILQQTRVAQGIPYYEKFVKKYPNVHALAKASEESVLSDWQGLGYNSRARNLHTAARHISSNLDGRFPDNYDDILALKGVGPYSAAAISSFAFGLSHPVVDGNVKRFLSRYIGIQESIDDRSTHREIERISESLISDQDPSVYNQAIMNFGALICVPGNPNCVACPLTRCCFAYIHGQTRSLPLRTARRPRRQRVFHYFALSWQDSIILRKRKAKDIWQNMFDLPMLESTADRKISKKRQVASLDEWGFLSPERNGSDLRLTQTLTHQEIIAYFYCYELSEKPLMSDETMVLSARENLVDFALPKIIDSFFKESTG